MVFADVEMRVQHDLFTNRGKLGEPAAAHRKLISDPVNVEDDPGWGDVRQDPTQPADHVTALTRTADWCWRWHSATAKASAASGGAGAAARPRRMATTR